MLALLASVALAQTAVCDPSGWPADIGPAASEARSRGFALGREAVLAREAREKAGRPDATAVVAGGVVTLLPAPAHVSDPVVHAAIVAIGDRHGVEPILDAHVSTATDGWHVLLFPASAARPVLGGAFDILVGPDGVVHGQAPLGGDPQDVDLATARGPGRMFLTSTSAAYPDAAFAAFAATWDVTVLVVTKDRGSWLVEPSEQCWSAVGSR